jgi:hypothetical protein
MQRAGIAATIVFSALFASGGAWAQEPSQPTARQAPQPGLQALDGQTVTVTGCLVREADVPGRQPTATERAGLLPDYFLSNVQVKSASPGGSAGATAGAEKPSTPAPSSAAGRGMHVKLVKGDNDEIKANLNRQVEITGRLDIADTGMNRDRPGATGGTEATGRPRTGATGQNSDQPVPQLEVQSVRVLNQSCAAGKQ